jgi:hypothetical protein
MDPAWRHPYGLRPTLRQLMIVVVLVAMLSALAAELLRMKLLGVATLLLPVAPLLLSMLVLLLDRPGPVKYWLVGLLGSLFLPALVAWFDGVLLTNWTAARALLAGRGIRGGGLFVLALFVLNAIGVASILRAARRRPRRCPDCGLRSVLPMGGLRWCASCGLKAKPGR